MLQAVGLSTQKYGSISYKFIPTSVYLVSTDALTEMSSMQSMPKTLFHIVKRRLHTDLTVKNILSFYWAYGYWQRGTI
jgi:hypothetical protein